MLLSKILNVLAGLILYGCVFVLTIGMTFNVALHEVFGFRLYTLEAVVVLITCTIVGSMLSNVADNMEAKKFHEYCKKNNIPSTLDNYNEYQVKLINNDFPKNDQ